MLHYSTNGLNGCEHDDLEEHKYRESKEYIQKGSLTHETLRSIIMDKRLLDKIPYFLIFLILGMLFHTVLLHSSNNQYRN